MTSTAVFFDLDNTLLRGTALIQLGRGLHSRGYLSARTMMRAAWLEAWFRVTGTEHAGHTREARDTVLSLIAGRDVEEFRGHCVRIFAERIVDRFCPEAVGLAEDHLTAGHDVWLVTASPVELAELCADHLGFTGGLGTVAERADGVYTGRLRDGLLHGPAKAVAVQALADEHGYDLAKAYAYSDSVNDLPMLETVGRPHAVNPDARLREHARAHDWVAHDFHDGGGTLRRRVTRGVAAGATIALAARAIVRRG